MDDPLAPRFKQISASTRWEALALTDRFLALREVFGVDLPENPDVRSKVREGIDGLLRSGATATLGARTAGCP